MLGRRNPGRVVAPRRAAAPRRRAAQHLSGSQPGICLPVLAARPRAAAARAVSAERVHSRTAQNEIRVVLGLLWWCLSAFPLDEANYVFAMR